MSHIQEYNTILANQTSLKIKRGDTVSVTFTFTDPNETPAADYDLSVFSEIRMQVKWYRESPEYFAELTLTGGDMVVSGAGDNVLTIDLFTDIKPGMYFYDVEGTRAGGSKETFLEGEYIIDQDATRVTTP